jgi:RNA polymerase sigma-70 factor, ECF subfamily
MIEFSAVYRRHWPDVLRFSLYLCGNQATAEDLASEAFLRAWMSTQPIRLGTVKAYLFMIVRNLYRDRLRRPTSAVTLNGSVCETRPGPDATIANRNELERVLAAMQWLPEAERAVLAMAAFGPMPYEQIAAAMNLSVSAVKVRIHRARVRLNIALGLDHSRNAP